MRLSVAAGAELTIAGTDAIRVQPLAAGATPGVLNLNGNAVVVDFGYAKDGSTGSVEAREVYPVAILGEGSTFDASKWSVKNPGGSFKGTFLYDPATRLVSVRMDHKGFAIIIR